MLMEKKKTLLHLLDLKGKDRFIIVFPILLHLTVLTSFLAKNLKGIIDESCQYLKKIFYYILKLFFFFSEFNYSSGPLNEFTYLLNATKRQCRTNVAHVADSIVLHFHMGPNPS